MLASATTWLGTACSMVGTVSQEKVESELQLAWLYFFFILLAKANQSKEWAQMPHSRWYMIMSTKGASKAGGRG